MKADPAFNSASQAAAKLELPADEHLVKVRGTQILAGDTRERYRQKIARITLDSMVQFVGLLDAKGTVLEINQVALDAVGIKLSEVEGRAFWTTFWWQVSDEINATLREMIARAALGEFVRWDAEIYGRAGGKETIIIDASLMPVTDANGKVVFIAAEGRDITEKKAYEREIARQREELAKLDVLKTQFFANVSHEFRTPLTLMLGPLEDVLANRQGPIPVDAAESLATSHRNALRLLKLVNALLDFSRIEAGRIQASYEPTDLRLLTTELASNFRSLCEKAGLDLIVDCEAFHPRELAYVDRDMWEKIVLNLVSNAFKFTLKGNITVRLLENKGHARLIVQDTGVGIPPEELPHMFERFHRVEHNLGRTHEGTGIGLALVQELIKLHGGTISVESVLGEGTTFTVTIPLGKSHLTPDKLLTPRTLSSTAVAHSAFVEEASRWLSDAPNAQERKASPGGLPPSHATKPRILWADDNADMRAYVSRLLENRFDVEPVADGKIALDAAIANPPDLILADIMMPKLDGFGLLRAVRGNPELREIPIILLSARAGEESKIEGIAAGADDYLVKPFSANELLARVDAALKLKRVREDARDEVSRSETRFRAFVTASSDIVYRMSPDWSKMFHLHGRDFIAETEHPSGSWLEKYIHPYDQQDVMAAIRKAIENKTPFELEHRVIRVDGSLGWTFSRAIPILNPQGDIVEWFGTARDVTERKQSEQAISRLTVQSEQQRRLYETILSQTPDFVYVFDLNHNFIYANDSLITMFGQDPIGKHFLQIGYPDWHAAKHDREIEEVIATKQPIRGEVPFTGTNGPRIYDYIFVPVFGPSGEVEAIAGTTRDVTDRKRSEEEIRRANKDLEQFAYTASHDLQEPLRSVKIYSQLLTSRYGDKLEGGALELFDFVCSGANRMEMLVRDLLAYTQTAMVERPSAPTEASEALQASIANLAGIISETGAKITFDPLPAVTVHRTHLQQLFQNLVGNAIKYRRRAVPPEIHIMAKPNSGFWEFCISDNGIGIEPEFKEQIFGVFKRLHGDDYSGTGIGLAICQRIVERYHGRIWVESELGKGSNFYVTIPI